MLAPALLALLIAPAAPVTPATFPPHLTGNVSAVYALLERVIPGSSTHFELALAPSCSGASGPAGAACFALSDASSKTRITGTSASELTGGLGVYLREWCNITVGWRRGGGSHVFTPKVWPLVGGTVSRARIGPFSHVAQVCTHSYTLVWHDWEQWQEFIDWMALAGHNSIVAPTGQEEVQYKVLTQEFGLSDMEVRNWTNGPAFLTWSRGQNAHGNSIGGPLPRSFMQSQHVLQKQILARYRELGILGHLPAFGGWAPWALAVAEHDTGPEAGPYHATRGGPCPEKDCDTAWLDGRDPLFTKVADAWMKQIIADFGSDHAWQMDGFFGNGTGWGMDEGGGTTTPATLAPAAVANDGWGDVQEQEDAPVSYSKLEDMDTHISGHTPGTCASGVCQALRCAATKPCAAHGCAGKDAEVACDIAALEQACTANPRCVGFNSDGWLKPCVNASCGATRASTPGVDTYVSSRHAPLPPPPPAPLPPDPVFLARAKGAYGAIERADGPTARWIYQGWALHAPDSGMSPPGPKHLARVHGFSHAAPPGNFILTDMAANGQWRKWKGTWGIPFIWTSLPDFGGNLYQHGNLAKCNEIPYAAPPLSPAPPGYNSATQVVGVGYTPEGLDQNPAYYELLQEAAFKAAPEPDLTAWLVTRAHRRYGLHDAPDPDVTAAWVALRNAGYANDGPTHDPTGVANMPAKQVPGWMGFEKGTAAAPKHALCLDWKAWGHLTKFGAANFIDAGSTASADTGGGAVVPLPKTFSYDLVDIGREVLSQLTIPLSQNFSTALHQPRLNAARIQAAGGLYTQVLHDLETLLTTDGAFLLGPWLQSARKIGGNASDCGHTVLG